MKKAVVLITSGQPSANPRLVKEAIALDNAGYNVKVIYVPISPWADEFDEQLFKTHSSIKFIRTGYHPQSSKHKFNLARARRKALSLLVKYIGNRFNIVDYSTILFGQELLKEAKKHKADLYIAHNLGALPVAFKVAEVYKAKVGFDAEDFHRGEFKTLTVERQSTEIIENKYLSKVDYLSVASPLIGKAYDALYSEISPVVINNVFPKQNLTHLPALRTPSASLKLIWFSQIVGKGRGLEDAIKAVCVNLQDCPVELTLVGNCSYSMREYLAKLVPLEIFDKKVRILEPVSSDDLFKIASQHHVGLALEPGRDLNNEIALSNKIFTYILAGNALILSDTQAQIEFYNRYPQIGSIYTKGSVNSIADVISTYLKEPDLLSMHQVNALQVAKDELNWDEEKKIFISLIESVLQP